MTDPVNHPKHYTEHPSGVECIEITEHMNFNCGNAVKYIWRADLKGDSIENLSKAEWCIRREIARRKKIEEIESTNPLDLFLNTACQITGDELDEIGLEDLVSDFNNWLKENGKAKWKRETIRRGLLDRCSIWKNPINGKMFKSVKRSKTILIGIQNPNVKELHDSLTRVQK